MRSIVKILLFALWLPLMILLVTPAWLIKWEWGRRFLVRLTFKGANAILGLRAQVTGALDTHRPLLLISNHSSYLDIFVLGATLPLAFTPKKEIAGWPIIGFCCKLAGCVFVERTPKAIARTKQQIAERLGRGRVMCIFAEGTTNDGTHLKPFKSSFFSLAEGEGVQVQPAALAYTHINKAPTGAEGRAALAWYDDMALLPHLMGVLKMRRIDAQLQLLPLLDGEADRKTLCAESERVVKQSLESMHE